jgi:cytochrome c553
MKRIERLLTAGIIALVILTGVAAQAGWFNPAAVGGALFGTATGIEVPPLDDPAMIRRGAGHYDRVCAGCHASPERPDRGEELALTPPPPKLHLRIDGWPPEVLFATIKHGIPNTAMPAWPAQTRDDEVWDMVAFLGVLPSLDVATYRQWAGLEVASDGVPPEALRCIGCHGTDGRGAADGAFPRLDIQDGTYLLQSLHAFRGGKRWSGFMESAVSGLRDDELAALSDYFAGEAELPFTGDAPPIVKVGIPERKVPACAGCHGPPSTRPEIPSLTGQHKDYLQRQLSLFVRQVRGGGPFAPLMHTAALGLSEESVEKAIEWYSAPN